MKVGKLLLKSSVLTHAALSQSVGLDISMAPTMPCQYNIAWHSGTWTLPNVAWQEVFSIRPEKLPSALQKLIHHASYVSQS